MAGQTLDIEVEGLDEIAKNLDALERRVATRVVRRAIRASARPVVKEIRRTIRSKGLEKDKRLYRSIGTVIPKSSQTKSMVYVGPRLKGKHIAPHGHLIEFGTGPRQTADGQNRGAVPPTPYMRSSWDKLKGNIVSDIINNLNHFTVEEIDKLSR